MKEPGAFLFLLVLLAAWPMLLAGLFALERRFPAGMPPRKRWIFQAAVTSILVPACVYFFVSGDMVRGVSLLASAIAVAAYELKSRPRPGIQAR